MTKMASRNTSSKKASSKKRNHALSDLEGKKIKTITLEEIKIKRDGSNVRQFYRLLCSDGNELILACDGGNDEEQYAIAEIWDPDDYEAFLEETRTNRDGDMEFDEDSEDPEEDFEDDDDEDEEDEDGYGETGDLDFD